MTVPSEQSRIQYTTDGTSVSFPVPFRFLNAAHLQVARQHDDESSILDLGVDYSVSGVGNQAGGTITTTSALPAGDTISIERVVPITQETAYQRNDPFPERAHEQALDKLTMICQMLGGILGLTPGSINRALLLGAADIDGKGSYRANGNRISNLGAPKSTTDAARKQDLIEALASLSTDGSGQFVIERLADSFSPENGASMVAYGKSTVSSALSSLRGIGVISDLRSYTGKDKLVYVTGYYSVGDGGGGVYEFLEDQTGKTDNGGTIINTPSGFYGLRYSGALNSAQFGVIAGGDVTPNAKQLSAFLKENPKIKCIVGDGKYSLTEAVMMGDVEQYIVSDISYSNKTMIFSGKSVNKLAKTLLTPWAGNRKDGTESEVPVGVEFLIEHGPIHQGLAYHDGFLYVGYDVSNGNGQIKRWRLNGKRDTAYGGVNIPTGHTAELAYRQKTEVLYASSSSGSEPCKIYSIAGDGKAAQLAWDMSAFGFSGLICWDNDNDLLVLSSTTTGDRGANTFRFFNVDKSVTEPLFAFTIPSEGIPQGIDVCNGIIYWHTNGKVTLLDYSGRVLDRWKIPVYGESQGLTVAFDGEEPFIAMGYTDPRRIASIRSPQSISRNRAISTLHSWNTESSNIPLEPVELSFSLRKQNGTWALAKFANESQIHVAAILKQPTTTTSRIEMELSLQPLYSLAAIHCSPGIGSPYLPRADYDRGQNKVIVEIRDYSNTLVTPQNAVDNILFVTIKGGAQQIDRR